MELCETVIITQSKGKPVEGQGDVTYLFGRITDKKFVTKRLFLLNPEEETMQKVIAVTRVK